MNIAGVYQWILRAYSGIPYRVFKSGYAFPAIHYYLEVTRRCNLRCRMCQYIDWLNHTSGALQQEGELSTDEWKRVIDQTGRFSLLTFTGGEPWVRQDFTELLGYACSKRLVHCISNCTLWTEETVERCIDLAPRRLPAKGLISLGVSLDAPGERHDAIRGLAGAFDKATRAVSLLTRRRRETGRRWPVVHVTSVIQEANLDVLPAMADVAAEIGADALNLTIENRFNDVEGVGVADPAAIKASDVPFPRLDPVPLDRALRDSIEAARKAGVALRLPRMPIEQVVRYYSGVCDLAGFQCREPWTTLYIGRKGNVFPCFIHQVGSVQSKPVREIWNGKEMRAFRQRCRKGLWPVCRGCCEMEFRG